MTIRSKKIFEYILVVYSRKSSNQT